DLDAVDEHRARLLAVDRQVDEGVRARMPAELLELVGVDGDVVGRLAVAVDDGRGLAGLAELGDLLAGRFAVFGSQRRAGGRHGADLRMVVSVRCGLRLAGGAGGRGARKAAARVPRDRAGAGRVSV